MSLSKTILPFLLALILLPGLALAQFTVDAEYRPRSEFRNGYRILHTPETEPAFFVSQRTRLSVLYESSGYELRVTGQDVRVWGEVEQLRDHPGVNIHEAWARLQLSEELRLKLGRQELIYDDQRLLGSVNWTQQGRSHDAAVLSYRHSDSDLSIDLGSAWNQEAELLQGNRYTINNYKTLSYLWASRPVGPLTASALLLADGFESPDGAPSFRYTYGTHLAYGSGPWQLTGTAYLQSGDDGGRRDISAYMLAGKIAYAWNAVRLFAGYDHLSGGKAGDARPSRHAFHTLYATNHKFYGHMDYFLNVPADTRGGGLQDLYLGVNVSLEESESTAIGLNAHRFALAGEIADPQNPGEVLEPYLGTEFDLSFSHRFTDEVALRLGYSTLFSGSSLKSVQGRNGKEMQHWGWAMLVLTP